MEQVRQVKEKLKLLDRVSMNGAFHSKRDVDMFYVSREDGGWGLISSGGCVRGEENSLEW